MAMLNEMRTNEKFDQAVHDIANGHFDGAFGEYRERPVVQRLAGL